MRRKRRLFDEVLEGVDAMPQQGGNRVTLRSPHLEDLPPLVTDADLFRGARERMRVSRAVLARRPQAPACRSGPRRRVRP